MISGPIPRIPSLSDSGGPSHANDSLGCDTIVPVEGDVGPVAPSQDGSTEDSPNNDNKGCKRSLNCAKCAAKYWIGPVCCGTLSTFFAYFGPKNTAVDLAVCITMSVLSVSVWIFSVVDFTRSRHSNFLSGYVGAGASYGSKMDLMCTSSAVLLAFPLCFQLFGMSYDLRYLNQFHPFWFFLVTKIPLLPSFFIVSSFLRHRRLLRLQDLAVAPIMVVYGTTLLISKLAGVGGKASEVGLLAGVFSVVFSALPGIFVPVVSLLNRARARCCGGNALSVNLEQDTHKLGIPWKYKIIPSAVGVTWHSTDSVLLNFDARFIAHELSSEVNWCLSRVFRRDYHLPILFLDDSDKFDSYLYEQDHNVDALFDCLLHHPDIQNVFQGGVMAIDCKGMDSASVDSAIDGRKDGMLKTHLAKHTKTRGTNSSEPSCAQLGSRILLLLKNLPKGKSEINLLNTNNTMVGSVLHHIMLPKINKLGRKYYTNHWVHRDMECLTKRIVSQYPNFAVGARPITVALLCGPAGCGKMNMACDLAVNLFQKRFRDYQKTRILMVPLEGTSMSPCTVEKAMEGVIRQAKGTDFVVERKDLEDRTSLKALYDTCFAESTTIIVLRDYYTDGGLDLMELLPDTSGNSETTVIVIVTTMSMLAAPNENFKEPRHSPHTKFIYQHVVPMSGSDSQLKELFEDDNFAIESENVTLEMVQVVVGLMRSQRKSWNSGTIKDMVQQSGWPKDLIDHVRENVSLLSRELFKVAAVFHPGSFDLEDARFFLRGHEHLGDLTDDDKNTKLIESLKELVSYNILSYDGSLYSLSQAVRAFVRLEASTVMKYALRVIEQVVTLGEHYANPTNQQLPIMARRKDLCIENLKNLGQHQIESERIAPLTNYPAREVLSATAMMKSVDVVSLLNQFVGDLRQTGRKPSITDLLFYELLVIRKFEDDGNRDIASTDLQFILERCADESDESRRCRGIARLYLAKINIKNDNNAAIEHATEALNILKGGVGDDDLLVGRCHYTAGYALQLLGQWDLSIEELRKALAHFKGHYVENDAVAHTYNNIAFVYLEQNDARWEEYMKRAMVIWKRILEPGHPNIAIVNTNFGIAHLRKAKFREAYAFLKDAHNAYTGFYGDNHRKTAESLVNMGELFRYWNPDAPDEGEGGDVGRSLDLHQRALGLLPAKDDKQAVLFDIALDNAMLHGRSQDCSGDLLECETCGKKKIAFMNTVSGDIDLKLVVCAFDAVVEMTLLATSGEDDKIRYYFDNRDVLYSKVKPLESFTRLFTMQKESIDIADAIVLRAIERGRG